MNKEHPIIFGSEMVKAILEGRKTQTRRVVKPNPAIAPLAECPYGNIGDRLWVREIWTEGYNRPFIESEGDDENAVFIIYKDGSELCRPCPAVTAEQWGDFSLDGDLNPIWKSPIFMPRWASRIDLRITNIRFEQLWAISESDARAEGVSCDLNCRRPFTELWDSINAKRGYGWATNPWVWVIEFERDIKQDRHNAKHRKRKIST